MKTTLNLDDHVLRAAKKLAVERGTTLTRIVEDALRSITSKPSREHHPVKWPIVKGRARPEVDISDRDALFERMEGRR